ncbi:MAG: acyl-CoA dehydratase activase [Chloroflexota bacterium]|nr:acyl-CoA dehydratase activase [Chloroflexota bacterium]
MPPGNIYLGIDVGSVTTKFAVLDEGDEVVAHLYLRTEGQPIAAIQRGLKQLLDRLPDDAHIAGVATTGSARYLAGVMVHADLVKNEISCQAAAALHFLPDAATIIEIGGQDSKIITIENGIVNDMGMNTVCAAGTGSFLDQQAQRMNIPIDEFGSEALSGTKPVHISGRCAVFAESDMIHKQQMGHRRADIIRGLCRCLAHNYLSNVATGKRIRPPVVFQGGVAFNLGMVHAVEETLGLSITVPPHPGVTGAIGAALLVHEELTLDGRTTSFDGFDVVNCDLRASSFECRACAATCEISQVFRNGKVLARWGGQCSLWEKEGNSI